MLATNVCPPAVVGFAARCSDSNKSNEDLCHHTPHVKQVLHVCVTPRGAARRGLLAIFEKPAFNNTWSYERYC